MATKEQLKILEVIKKEKALAKSKHLKVGEQLSGGYSKYKTAINTMISVGALSVVFSVIKIVMDIFDIAAYTAGGGFWDDQSIILMALEFGVLAITAILGWKLYTLDATPLFILVSLIIIFVANAFLFAGILPLLTVVLSAVGLICWSTYRNWFNDIDAGSHKKHQKRGR